MSNNNTALICSYCACGIANDDWTWLDHDPDDEVGASVSWFLEQKEWTVQSVDRAEMIRCACCGCDAMVAAEVM